LGIFRLERDVLSRKPALYQPNHKEPATEVWNFNVKRAQLRRSGPGRG
jgi:hypothetical protein